jgi:hypothetical protein
LIGGVVAAAAVRTFPFRVFSFPSEIVLGPATATDAFGKILREIYGPAIKEMLNYNHIRHFSRQWPVLEAGKQVKVQIPARIRLC